jgi:hypothetical protein
MRISGANNGLLIIKKIVYTMELITNNHAGGVAYSECSRQHR